MQKRLKKILVKLIIIALCVGCLIFYLFQKRNYYCLAEDKCITVWKTSEGAFIIPGKYTSWFKPKDNYIKADNLGSLDIIWKTNNEIIGYIDDSSKIVNKNKNQVKILNYKDNKKTYDSIYTYQDGHYLRYKNSVNYISIDIKESYASTSDGRVLK